MKLRTKRISKSHYRELMYFCMQYGEKKIAGKKEDCKLIEDTAAAVDKTIGTYIMKNVTEGIPFEYMHVPCGRNQFYKMREDFFYKLSLKR